MRQAESFTHAVLNPVLTLVRKLDLSGRQKTESFSRASQFWRKVMYEWKGELEAATVPLAHIYMVGGNSELYKQIKADFRQSVIAIEEKDEKVIKEIQAAIKPEADPHSYLRAGQFPHDTLNIIDYYSLLIGWDVLHGSPEDVKNMVYKGLSMVRQNGMVIFDADLNTAKECESFVGTYNEKHPMQKIYLDTVPFGDFQSTRRKQHIPGAIMKFRKHPSY